LVSNAETVAQVATLSLHGVAAFSSFGTAHCTGTRLVTMAGDVRTPGEVLEVVGSATFGDLLQRAGHREPPPYVLLGGYAGTWVSGEMLFDCEISDHSLNEIGAGLGCGLVGVIGEGQCPLAELERLVRYLASESAGQCGPCVRGLPSIATLVEKLGRSGRSGSARRIRQLSEEIVGRGACSHPDATVAMVESALAVMTPEITRHRHGSCVQVGAARPVFSIPPSAARTSL
jgi:NADH:ubiquinone oxidoreductase subunit F (NADH-binding)